MSPPSVVSGIRRAAARALRHLPYGIRLLDVYESWRTDVYLISFPKCGRMWLVVMIGKLLQIRFHLPDDIDITDIAMFPEYNKNSPRIQPTHTGAHPTFSTPDQMKRIPRKYLSHKTIFLVRDPRDSIVSQYFRNKPRYHKPIRDWLSEYPEAFMTALTFYDTWSKEMNKYKKNILLVRYEDLHAEPEKQLKRITDWLPIKNVTDHEIKQSVEFASLQHMQKLEKKGHFDRIKKSNNDYAYHHVRKGQMGEYKEVLPADIIEEWNCLMKRMLPAVYGYKPCRRD
ncbi:sulfotransferase domain-containing protein [Candidatus Peregrinibacteria bacterium]|nr:sulfotransferase domain-containing protein [Candidatus Peregrinibacteria bacterium]